MTREIPCPHHSSLVLSLSLSRNGAFVKRSMMEYQIYVRLHKKPQQSLKVSESCISSSPSLLSGNKCTFVELIGAPRLRVTPQRVEKMGFDFGVSSKEQSILICSLQPLVPLVAMKSKLRRDAEVSGSLKFGSSGSLKWTSLLPFKAWKFAFFDWNFKHWIAQ